MAARFEHEGTPQMVLVLASPRAPLELRAALGRGPPARDQAERFARRVGINRRED